MRYLKHRWYYIFIALVIAGCSTKKNTFLRRSVHSVGAEYNVLFNGNEALRKGKEALITSYVDNYWQILPVERLKVDEDVILPDQKDKNPNFKKAEEKATKAIQKHSMNIDGREYNPQMDEAYLLLGKARYYDQRFIPSMEAFNYVLYKYWTGDKANEARLWREKVNIRLENEELALKNLERMLRLEKLNPELLAHTQAIVAQAHINLGNTDKAIEHLETAVENTKNYEEQGRYYFIIGQLYNSKGDAENADRNFDKIIELHRKTLRVYVINAHLEKIRNVQPKDSVSDALLLEFITALEEDYENNAFLDKIYLEKAMFYADRDSIPLMEKHFNKSIGTGTNDTYLKAFIYGYMAQFRFDNVRYKEAGLYYDSTLTNMAKNTKKYRLIQKKRNSLNDVIKYEDIARETDSILGLIAMSDDEKTAFFETYIQELKDLEEQKAEALREQKRKENAGTLLSPGGANVKKADAVFYFYNPVTLQYGRNEFRQVWGERRLQDNWRLGDKTIIAEAEEETGSSEKKATENKYDVAFYTAKLPTDERVIDSIKTERNRAYYQLGILYKEKFREYGLAVDKFNTLLQNDPEKQLVLQSKYNLYKIYETLQAPEAETVKNDILTRHPDSRYAAMLRNPDAVLSDDAQSPEMVYTELFRTFEEQQYETVIEKSDQYISQFAGDPMAPKFEMLKASALGRLKGFEAYKEALEYIVLNYANTEEGEEAARIIKEDLKTLERKNFVAPAETSSWKLVFPLQRSDEKKVKKLYKTIEKSLKDFNYDYLSLSTDIYTNEQLFIVVHGFESEDRALGYAEFLTVNRKYRIRDKHFPVTSGNYTTIQVHKNLEDYTKEKQKS